MWNFQLRKSIFSDCIKLFYIVSNIEININKKILEKESYLISKIILLVLYIWLILISKVDN